MPLSFLLHVPTIVDYSLLAIIVDPGGVCLCPDPYPHADSSIASACAHAAPLIFSHPGPGISPGFDSDLGVDRVRLFDPGPDHYWRSDDDPPDGHPCQTAGRTHYAWRDIQRHGPVDERHIHVRLRGGILDLPLSHRRGRLDHGLGYLRRLL